MENQIFELQFAIDTFYFLVCGVLVMWMAAGFCHAGVGPGPLQEYHRNPDQERGAVCRGLHDVYDMRLSFHVRWRLFLSGIETVTGLDVDAALATSAENGFGGDAVYAGASDFFFQAVFVAATMSIISGAVAERMKLWAFLVFAVFMTGIIYPLEGSWTWGGDPVFGLYKLSYSDYAGSGIVHMAGAAAALAGVIILGPRKGKYTADGKVRPIPGANLPLATLGTFILWLGWFGFNGGSTLKLGGIAAANEVPMSS